MVVLLTCVYLGKAFAQAHEEQTAEKNFRSTYDRIQYAADMKEITLKETVMLEAMLKFAPDSFPKNSKYAPLPGERLVDEECGTGFYMNVHRAFPELNKEEKELLKALSPDLKLIIEAREKESTTK